MKKHKLSKQNFLTKEGRKESKRSTESSRKGLFSDIIKCKTR